MEILKLIYCMESETDIWLTIKEGYFSNIKLSSHLNLKDSLIKTCLYFFKSHIRSLDERMINLGLQTKMIGKMINFYKSNADYIEDIVHLNKDNNKLKDDIFDENCNIE